MKNFAIVLWMALGLVGCASNESQIRETLQKNPKIVFDLIEENPEQFIEVVNRTAQRAQQKQREQQVALAKSEQEKDLKSPRQPELQAERRLLGDDKGQIVIVEYADFQCPACQLAYKSLKEFKEKYKNEVAVLLQTYAPGISQNGFALQPSISMPCDGKTKTKLSSFTNTCLKIRKT